MQRHGIEHDNGAVLEPHPAPRGPGSQLFVDALARHADHLADLLLRDGDGLPLRFELPLLGQAEQRAGQPPRQVSQNPCSTWSLVQRSFAHKSSMNFIDSSGWLFTKGRKSRLS